MPVTEVVTRTLYEFNELSDTAKGKARDWYREASVGDEWWDSVYEDAETMAGLLGITLNTRKGVLAISFSGFSSQGDGASWEGTYQYKKGAAKAIRAEAPTDAELHRIADALQAVQRRHFYKLRATSVHRGHYQHSGCMHVEVEHDDDLYRDIGNAEGEVIQLLRDFADWIYKQLEAECDYLNADAQVDENIVANEYTFTVDGSIA